MLSSHISRALLQIRIQQQILFLYLSVCDYLVSGLKSVKDLLILIFFHAAAAVATYFECESDIARKSDLKCYLNFASEGGLV